MPKQRVVMKEQIRTDLLTIILWAHQVLTAGPRPDVLIGHNPTERDVMNALKRVKRNA